MMRNNRSRWIVRATGALACAAALTAGGVVGAAAATLDGAGAAPSSARSATHWFEQTEPYGQGVFLHNGTTPAGGRSEITLHAKKAPYPYWCFAEKRNSPDDLGTYVQVRKGATVVLARNAPAKTDYSVLCFVKRARAPHGAITTGTVTETVHG